MDAESALEAVAQIAVSVLIWLSFWVLISSSLSAVFAALFPLIPHSLGATVAFTWATSSVVLILITVCKLAAALNFVQLLYVLDRTPGGPPSV